MRVALLNDLPVAGPNTSGVGSGAELTCGRFVVDGTRRGHEVDVVCPEYLREGTLDQYEVVVAKNVVNFHPDQLKLVQKRPYVAWPSDFAWTKWRLFFAFQENHRGLSNAKAWTDWFTRSRLNVFLSPFHFDCYKWMMPSIEGHPTHLSPPPANEHLFRPAKEGWEECTAATINGGLQFKGLYPNLGWATDHPDVKFFFLGAIRENVNLPPNARHVGPLEQSKLAEILGHAETYVELADTCQPYNQTAIQGLLSCRRVVTNGLVGAASYEWFRRGDREQARAELRLAMPKLWERIETEAAP